MRRVRLVVRAPQGAIDDVFDVLTGADYVDSVTGLHWNVTGDRLVGLLFVEGDADAYLADLEAIPSVRDCDVARAGDDAFYVYQQCTVDGVARALFETFTSGSLLVVPPVEYGDGSVAFSLFGQSAEIQAAIERTPDAVDVEVQEIGGMAGTPQMTAARLSDRQREAADAALSLGYYEIPREASHEDVAEAIGCAPSTAAEHLRKAEAKLLESTLRTSV